MSQLELISNARNSVDCDSSVSTRPRPTAAGCGSQEQPFSESRYPGDRTWQREHHEQPEAL